MTYEEFIVRIGLLGLALLKGSKRIWVTGDSAVCFIEDWAGDKKIHAGSNRPHYIPGAVEMKHPIKDYSSVFAQIVKSIADVAKYENVP